MCVYNGVVTLKNYSLCERAISHFLRFSISVTDGQSVLVTEAGQSGAQLPPVVSPLRVMAK